MPHITQHNKHMIQASQWSDGDNGTKYWYATCNKDKIPMFYGNTPEEAINMIKEYLDENNR